MPVRTLAYFLPQFHECSFNNEWWGKGFTEWDNVRNAQPLRDGHQQPRVPQGGEFQLDNIQELATQFAQAQQSGVEAFVFYHYWYNGKRPLGRPFDLILENPDLKIQFSLCWANHSWTRTWRNRRGALDVLIEQVYGATYAQREEHFSYLTRAFSDPRYTRIDGKPLFQIYIPEDVPQVDRYCDELREFALQHIGNVPHIAATVRKQMRDYSYLDAFDSITLAQPTLGIFGPEDIFTTGRTKTTRLNKLRAKMLDLPLPVRKLLYFAQDMAPKHPTYYSYDTVWQNILTQSRNALENAPRPVNLTGFVDFDNTPRYRKSAKIMQGFTPETFETSLRALAQLATQTDNQLLFVNAWNEWGEGMYLQGDSIYPTERLAALRNAVAQE